MPGCNLSRLMIQGNRNSIRRHGDAILKGQKRDYKTTEGEISGKWNLNINSV